MRYLRQSTASQTRTIGPFIDDADFKSLENGLTISNTDIVIKKNGASSGTKNSGGATADGSGGLYHLTWDATDTATVGELYYSVKVAGSLVVFGAYTVLEEAEYDARYAASAPGYVANAPVNVAQFGGVNGSFSGGIPAVNTTLIEGSDATNQIRDAVVDDATRIDASALNTLSSHDPGETIMGATDLDTPLSDIQIVTDKLDDTLEDDGGTYRFTANALEEGPGGGSGATAQEVWEYNISSIVTANQAATVLKARASQTSVDAIDDFVDTEVAAIKTVTDKLDDTLEDDGGTYRFTANALEEAPTGSGSGATAQEVWEYDINSIVTANQAATVLKARASQTSVDTIDGNVDTILVTTDKLDDTLEDNGSGTYRFTAGALEEAPTGSGSGASAQEVWEYNINSIVTANQAATVLKARASQTSVDTIDDFLDTEIAAIKAKTDQLVFTTTNRVDAQVFGIENNAITANSIAANAITDAKVASDVTIASVTGSVGSVTNSVTVGTNNDKTGYSLTQSFPSNFASLAITAGGAVTVGTNNDKTGYSLSQGFPTNFSSLSIDSSGRVLLQPTQTGVTIPTVTTLTNAPSDSSGVTTLLTRLPSAISLSGGAVTVGTNNDKTGYSLSQGFPSNFASLAINGSGHVVLQDSSLVTAKLGTFALAKTTNITGFNDPTVGAIADAVWDEVQSGHTTAGTFGKYLDDEVSSVSSGGIDVGDIATAVWTDLLATSDFSTVGSIGKLLKDNVDVPISSRAASVDTGGDDAVEVNHNYGGTNALSYVDGDGIGIDNATIRIYLEVDYDAGRRSQAYVVAETTTTVSGHWSRSIMLDPDDYTIVFYKQGAFGPDAVEVTVE